MWRKHRRVCVPLTSPFSGVIMRLFVLTQKPRLVTAVLMEKTELIFI